MNKIKVFLSVCGVLLPGLVYGATIPLSRADIVRYTGEAAYDAAGYSVSGAGDVNNDGYDDMIVGAHGNHEGGLDAGAAYLIYGSASGITSESFSSAVKFTGEAAYDAAGYSVSAGGDMNGDGYDDVIIGAFGNSSNTGAVYIVYGKAEKYTGSVSLSTAAKFTGEAVNDGTGYSVSGAGDMNSDGYDDVIVGAFGNSSNTGAVYIVYGKAKKYSGVKSLSTAAKFIGEAGDNYVGLTISDAGDVNGDGYDDIVVGSNINDTAVSLAIAEGAVYIVYGKAEKYSGVESLSTAAKFTGEAGGDYAGHSVSGAGDMNGDGYDDIILSAIGDDTAGGLGSKSGAVYIVYGKAKKYTGSASLSTAVKLIGEDGDEKLGYSVSGAGDVNGDGYDDVIIGLYGSSVDAGASSIFEYSSNTGAAYVMYGKSKKYSSVVSISTADGLKFTGQERKEDYAYSVSGGGDVNGDGYDDMLIGDPYKFLDTGAVYLVMPPKLPTYTLLWQIPKKIMSYL